MALHLCDNFYFSLKKKPFFFEPMEVKIALGRKGFFAPVYETNLAPNLGDQNVGAQVFSSKTPPQSLSRSLKPLFLFNKLTVTLSYFPFAPSFFK